MLRDESANHGDDGEDEDRLQSVKMNPVMSKQESKLLASVVLDEEVWCEYWVNIPS